MHAQDPFSLAAMLQIMGPMVGRIAGNVASTVANHLHSQLMTLPQPPTPHGIAMMAGNLVHQVGTVRDHV